LVVIVPAMGVGQRFYARLAAWLASQEFMSSRNTDSLHGFYVSAPRAMKRIAPQDIGVQRIGHFGFFHERFEETLWQGYLLPELA
jgi:predicted alpha/beta hydrolase